MIHQPPRMPMPELIPLIEAAAAHPDFKRDILDFVQQGAPANRIELKGHAPRVKVERVLTQLLHEHPTLRIERVRLTARSGCSDYTGEIVAVEGELEHRFAFTWCCSWRAQQLGWKDCFGFWDQTRAAREFGWRCFERWERLAS